MEKSAEEHQRELFLKRAQVHGFANQLLHGGHVNQDGDIQQMSQEQVKEASERYPSDCVKRAEHAANIQEALTPNAAG